MRNHGVFCFECSSFEIADFFLRSADGDFLISDSLAAGTLSMPVAAGLGEARPSIWSCCAGPRWTGSLVLLLMTLGTGVVSLSSILCMLQMKTNLPCFTHNLHSPFQSGATADASKSFCTTGQLFQSLLLLFFHSLFVCLGFNGTFSTNRLYRAITVG